jgi:hypothetical protein
VLALDRLGWVRTDPIQGGRVHAWQKVTRAATALLTLEPGIYLGAPQDDPRQTLGPILVLAPRDEDGETILEPVAIGSLDHVFFSELVRDLETLADAP